MGAQSFVHSVDGIDWYCERRGQGSDIVLVPSGEGDCASFERVAEKLADQFTVLTFDMPGFSRTSVPADPADFAGAKIGEQVAALIRSLDVANATFYGCSSGGLAVLWLAINHADLVRNAIVHEVAFDVRYGEKGMAALAGDLASLDDATIVKYCKVLFSTIMNEDQDAWENLGPEYHQRLERNYANWVRRYVLGAPGLPIFAAEELKNRPITWTIGGLTPARAFFSNVLLTREAEIQIGLLNCRHFPQVSIPEALAEHIRASALQFLS